jgi:hypothetical protein
VVSSILSIGKVKGRKIRNRMPRAICVVGGDKRSSIWIKKNRSKLESINALCIVVNVEYFLSLHLVFEMDKIVAH